MSSKPSHPPEGTPTVTRPAVAEQAPEPPAPVSEQPSQQAQDQPAPSEGLAAARGAIQQTRSADQPPAETGPDWASVDAEAHPDDLDAEHQGLSSTELLQRELGAQMIEEIRHQ